MLNKEKLARLNELARKAKNENLSSEEIIERDLLRKEYIKNFRKSFRQRLENIEIVDENDERLKK